MEEKQECDDLVEGKTKKSFKEGSPQSSVLLKGKLNCEGTKQVSTRYEGMRLNIGN